jgi:aspartate/methionine/tyrosine aminotransferase
MILDVEQGLDKVPKKYFELGNYEDDPNTVVTQRHFEDRVPNDYALARWMAIEKGIALMPMSVFYYPGSPYMREDMVRIAICKSA